MNLLQKTLKNGFLALFSLFITSLLLLGCLFFYMYLELPDVTTLKNMQLQVPLRVFTNDGKLIAEYGENHRIPIGIDQIPKKLIQGILATEDQRYFEHPGVDLIGMVRAIREFVITGRKSQGASTITMQVARNFFLTRQKTFGRKLNEILLALKIDATLSKKKVLELYLNKIYLGQRAYGVAAAADVYYGKTLKELTLPELAMLAGLPQAPSRDNPIENPHAALERRNHVLERMLSSGYIDKASYDKAVATPITAHLHNRTDMIDAPYVGEMVRAAMIEAYGSEAYANGLKVYTTIDSHLQIAANEAVKNGLSAYDRRHGYHGVERHITKPSQWLTKLREIPTIHEMSPAVVVNTSPSITAILANGKKVSVDTRIWPTARLKRGDVIRLLHKSNSFELTQMPKAEAALVSIDPNTGRIIALNGGFSFHQSSYNRATQAKRQPGSSFKPFIYSAALEKDFTLASIIDDAPITLYIPGSNTIWRPQNSNLRFYGPISLRFALVHSRNTVSVRILQAIGVSYAIDYATRFGFDSADMPRGLTLALGTASVTPMQMASGFAAFANGGYKVKPYFIDHITDDDGKTLYQADPPNLERAITAENAYLMNSLLQDVIRRGTGRRALALNRKDIAGKTGTTNDQMDGWFSGFNGDLVTTVWIGYDQPRSLYENGAVAALPIWIDFMQIALAGKPEHTLSQPPNIIRTRIDPRTGNLLNPNQPYGFDELFDKSHMPAQFGDTNEENTLQIDQPNNLDTNNGLDQKNNSETELQLDKPNFADDDEDETQL